MTEWLVDHDWQYHCYPLDEPGATFPAFASILALWRAKGGGGLPAWADFDFLDFEGWWGWISVYDVLDLDEPRFRVRLWGTRVAEMSGIDPTGEILMPETCASHVDSSAITLNDMKFTAHICKERLIGHMYGPQLIRYGERWMYFEIYLPLSSDGENVDKIMFAGRSERRI